MYQEFLLGIIVPEDTHHIDVDNKKLLGNTLANHGSRCSNDRKGKLWNND